VTQYMPQYPPPGPGYYTPPPPPPQNGFGTAAFVLGLLGLLFSFIPLIGIIAWPLVLLALIFAAIGLSRVRAHRATNQGLTIAGLVCAVLGLGICIAYAAVFSAAVSSTPTSAPRATTAYAAPSGEEGSTAAARIGDVVQDGSFTFTVTDVQTGVHALGDSLLRSEAQGSYVLVHVTVTNVGTESAMFTSSNQTLLDGQGRKFDADASAALMNVPDSQSFLMDINPGNSVDGVLVFDVPEGLSPAAIELHESIFTSGTLVYLFR
jgi:uncharacterized protein DUF4352